MQNTEEKKKSLSELRFDGEHREGFERFTVPERFEPTHKEYSDVMEEYNEDEITN